MENRKILFTAPGKAELVSCEMPRIAPDEVLIETDYTAISAGTERANLLDMPNVTHSGPNTWATAAAAASWKWGQL